jgi:antirestriction protein ArdC
MLDIAQIITDRIISELEKGATPWVKPWRTLKGMPGAGMPHNPLSGTHYRGINHLWLSMLQGAYTTPYWVTLKQANKANARIREGERGTPVVFWSVSKKDSKGANGETVTSAYAFIKHYHVYNIEQVEGLILPEAPPAPVADFDQSPTVMALIDRLALSGGLTHAGDSAYFQSARDLIVMPPMAAFASAANYHATLLHEAVHATGHESRLKRLTPARFGSDNYAYEELVAELGAAMLCAHTGIDGDLRHAGYIESWLKALKNDKKFILSASGKAQAAMDFLTASKQVEAEQDEALAA